jgi:uncharacterized membrane protein YdfJ with MMPL/SSD domain
VFNNLWADYKDSSDSTYVVVGVMLAAVACIVALPAVWSLWDARPLVRAASVVLGVVCGAGLVLLLAYS